MEITLSLKDIIYIGTYIVTIVTIIAAVKYRIMRLEESNKVVKNIIFGDKGNLNIIDNESCKIHRDCVYSKIREESTLTQKALGTIECLSQNVMKIMIHMDLEPIEKKRKND